MTDVKKKAVPPHLPDYDRFIIESMCNVLRSWIDKIRHNVVWLHAGDIEHLEDWAKGLAKQYRDTELHFAAMVSEPEQPNEGWTPAEPWPHRASPEPVKASDEKAKQSDSTSDFPLQPLVWDDDIEFLQAGSIVRFRENRIVIFLFKKSGVTHDELMEMPFDRAEIDQFFQLLGWSACAYCDLDFVRDDVRDEVDRRAKAMKFVRDTVAKQKSEQKFETEYQNVPPSEDSLVEYGLRYHRECEEYDLTVCTQRNKAGFAIPISDHEASLIARHSIQVRKQLADELVEAGLSRPETSLEMIKDAIGQAVDRFRREWAREREK